MTLTKHFRPERNKILYCTRTNSPTLSYNACLAYAALPAETKGSTLVRVRVNDGLALCSVDGDERSDAEAAVDIV